MLDVFMPLLSHGNETEVFQMAYTDAVIELTFLVENVLGNSSIEQFQAPLSSLVEKYKEHLDANLVGSLMATSTKTIDQYSKYIQR